MTEKLTQNILVPTDFSRASELAIDAARLLAVQNDAHVTLMHVFDPALATVGAAGLGEATAEQIPADVEKAIHDQLAQLREKRLDDVPSVKTALVLGRSAAHGIVHYAEKEKVDMIVVSTHGRTGLAHLLIGSVAEKVVRHAPCPVLTLRSHAVD